MAARDLTQLFGLHPSARKDLRRYFYASFILFAVIFVVFIIHLTVMSASWGLVSDLPQLWFIQLLIVMEGWQISGYESVQPNELRRHTIMLVMGMLFSIVAFIWAISEIVHCGNHDASTRDAQAQCYRNTQSQFSPDASGLCLMDYEIQSSATGVCPYAQFGASGGIAWSVWQMFVVIFIPIIDGYLLYCNLSLENEEAVKAAQDMAAAASGGGGGLQMNQPGMAAQSNARAPNMYAAPSANDLRPRRDHNTAFTF